MRSKITSRNARVMQMLSGHIKKDEVKLEMEKSKCYEIVIYLRTGTQKGCTIKISQRLYCNDNQLIKNDRERQEIGEA